MTGWNLWVRPNITKEENVILKIIKLHKIKTKEWHAGKNNHLQIMGSQYQSSKKYSEFRWEEQHGRTLRTLGSVKQFRQRKTNTIWSHLYLESKKKGNIAQTGGCQSNECAVGEGYQKVGSFSYKVKKP